MTKVVIRISGVARKFFQGEQIQRVFPPLPFPSLPFPLSSLPLPSPFPPFLPPLRSRIPKIQPGRLGERCELPSGVWDGAPAEIELGAS